MPAVPKPADKRARRNAGGVEFKSVEITPGVQPELPERDQPWSQETLRFWASIGDTELSRDFTDAEWSVLMIAALAHEEIWTMGKLMRVDQFMGIMARFPFTPKDRQALRIQTLTGDDLARKVESTPETKAQSQAKKSYGMLKAV